MLIEDNKVTTHPATDTSPAPVPPLDLGRRLPSLGLAVELHLLPRLHRDGVPLLGLHDVGLPGLTVGGEGDHLGLNDRPG